MYNKEFLKDYCKIHIIKMWEKKMLFKYQDDKNLRLLFDMRYVKLIDSDYEHDSIYNKKYKLLMSKLIKKPDNKFLFITINYDPKKHSISCGDPHKSINKILNTNCIKSWAFAFEWRKHAPRDYTVI